jgi:hypothetical protein
MPDWLLFGLIFFIFLIMYFIVIKDEETKNAIKRFLLNYGIYILAIVVVIYGWNKWGIVADHDIGQMKWALFIVVLGLDLYFIASNLLYRERYNTIPFQANGVYGSVALYYNVGKYTIFYLGTSGKSDFAGIVLPWYFPQKICIVPKTSWQFNGNAIICYIKVSKDNYFEVPEIVKNTIEGDSRTMFARDEIYYGELRNKILIEDQQMAEMDKKLKDSNSRINELKSMLRGKLTDVKTFVTDTEAIKDRMSGNRFMRGNNQSPPKQEF